MVAHLPPPGPSPEPGFVPVAPNTVMAAARALQAAAEAADQFAVIDPRDLLPEDVARELVARSAGDGDAWREIAQRLSRSMVRAGWPDPLDPWP